MVKWSEYKKKKAARKAKETVKTTSSRKLVVKPGSLTDKYRKAKASIKKKRPKASKKAIKAAAEVKIAAIKPKTPAIISQQIDKAKKVPFIIGGVIIAFYMLFKKLKKGGKK